MASVTKRRWTYKGVTKEGWEVRYFDEKGVRRSKTLPLKKDADAFKRKVEREIEDGTHTAAAAAKTIAEVAAEYVRQANERAARGEIGLGRAVRIEQMVRRHVVPHVGGHRFEDMTPAKVDDYFGALIATPLDPFVAKMILGNVGTIERFAQRRGYVKTSLFAAALKGMRPVKMPKVRNLTIDQASLLMRLCLTRRPKQGADDAARLACAVHLAGCCGLRNGEIRALDWKSVDFEAGVIRVSRGLDALDNLKGPKSDAGNREVWMPDHLAEMLRQWREKYATPNADGFVFTTRKGRKLTQGSISRHPWRRLLAEAGLSDDGGFRFHSLRHFAGSWWIENGLKIADVSKMIGHADPSTTLRVYTHSLSRPDDRRAALRDMGRKLLSLTDAREPQQAA